MSAIMLTYDKSTENKLRWTRYVDGVAFHLYIPRHATPIPLPQNVIVDFKKEAVLSNADSSGILAEVRFVVEHTQTVRYAPVGDPSNWKIGEPYIPHTLLPKPWPKRLYVAISWNQEYLAKDVEQKVAG